MQKVTLKCHSNGNVPMEIDMDEVIEHRLDGRSWIWICNANLYLWIELKKYKNDWGHTQRGWIQNIRQHFGISGDVYLETLSNRTRMLLGIGGLGCDC